MIKKLNFQQAFKHNISVEVKNIQFHLKLTFIYEPSRN